MSQTKMAVIRSIFLLGVKFMAYAITGSAVLMAAMLDSMVDVVASLIAHYIKPNQHYEEHHLAVIQASWIVFGGALVFVESTKQFNESVEMAWAGIFILLLTLVIDGSIVRKLDDSTPVIKSLKEDIMADISNSLGGLVALVAISLGAPMQVDKVIAMSISIMLIFKGARLVYSNIVEASIDHMASHNVDAGGLYLNPLHP